ncbi:hypothetical protein ES703_47389 [subsurface metagenome]
MLIYIRPHGDMVFGSTDYYAVLALLYHPKVEVGVDLLVRTLAAVTFSIALRGAAHKVVFLIILQKLQETLMVFSSFRIVDLFGDYPHSVDGICGHTALDAPAHSMAQGSDHLLLLEQVVNAGVDISEPIYLFSGEVGGSYYQVLKLRVSCCLECVGHSTNAWRQYGVISLDSLTTNINVGFHPFQPFPIFIGSFYRHLRFSFLIRASLRIMVPGGISFYLASGRPHRPSLV